MMIMIGDRELFCIQYNVVKIKDNAASLVYMSYCYSIRISSQLWTSNDGSDDVCQKWSSRIEKAP